MGNSLSTMQNEFIDRCRNIMKSKSFRLRISCFRIPAVGRTWTDRNIHFMSLTSHKCILHNIQRIREASIRAHLKWKTWKCADVYFIIVSFVNKANWMSFPRGFREVSRHLSAARCHHFIKVSRTLRWKWILSNEHWAVMIGFDLSQRIVTIANLN